MYVTNIKVKKSWSKQKIHCIQPVSKTVAKDISGHSRVKIPITEIQQRKIKYMQYGRRTFKKSSSKVICKITVKRTQCRVHRHTLRLYTEV